MFRILGVATLLALSALSAHAEDIEGLKTRYYDLRGGCRQSEMGDKTLNEAETQQACDELAVVGKKLQEANLCWDNSELVWDKCPLTN